MGQRISRKQSKPPVSTSSTEKGNKMYPLPVEAQMLRQIKEQYQTNENHDSSALSPAKDLILELLARRSANGENWTDTVPPPLQEYFAEHLLQSHMYTSTHEAKGEMSQDPQTFKVLDFPNLVVQKVLEFLDPTSILNLRLTCTQTKAWIDRNHYILRDFEVHITNEMCGSNDPSPHTSPWSNITVPYVRLHSFFVEKTINDNCDYIWKLDICAPKCITNVSTNYPPNHPHRLFQVINKCPRIQHLSLCRLDTLTELGEFEYLFIRVLSIDRIQWMNNSDFDLFENLIMKCPNLEYLKMPDYEILGSLAFVFFESRASPEKEHLIRPVINYLDRYRNPNSGVCVPKTKLYIDVVEFEDFKLCSSEIFYELSRKCVECNSVLMNVYFVPRDALIRNQQNIVESFASMFGFIKIDFKAELWKNLEVMECWIEDFPDDLDLTTRQLSFLKTISKIRSLRSLTIRLSVEEPYVCSAALETCVDQCYNGVEKLILRRHHINPDSHVRIPLGFGAAFVNVKYLYLQELDSTDQDFRRMWPGMPNLEELFAYKCPYITQEAFILPNSIDGDGNDVKGEDFEQPILKLKKLQTLVIFLFDGNCGFNDQFIFKALRYMRLKGFALRGIAGIEFSEAGMLSLLDSPFHETIEDFEAPSSSFRANLSAHYWHFYTALPKKELRRNRIWLSCSVLLNSLSSRKHPYDYRRKCLGI